MEGLLILLGIGVIIFIICVAVGGTKELSEQNAEETKLKLLAQEAHDRGKSWLDIHTGLEVTRLELKKIDPIGRQSMALVGAMAWVAKQIPPQSRTDQIKEMKAKLFKSLKVEKEMGMTLGDSREGLVRAMVIMKRGAPGSADHEAGLDIIAHLDKLLETASDEDKQVGVAARLKIEETIAAELKAGVSYEGQLAGLTVALEYVEKDPATSALEAGQKDCNIISFERAIDCLNKHIGRPSLDQQLRDELMDEFLKQRALGATWTAMIEVAEKLTSIDAKSDEYGRGARIGREMIAYLTAEQAKE